MSDRLTEQVVRTLSALDEAPEETVYTVERLIMGRPKRIGSFTVGVDEDAVGQAVRLAMDESAKGFVTLVCRREPETKAEEMVRFNLTAGHAPTPLPLPP